MVRRNQILNVLLKALTDCDCSAIYTYSRSRLCSIFQVLKAQDTLRSSCEKFELYKAASTNESDQSIELSNYVSARLPLLRQFDPPGFYPGIHGSLFPGEPVRWHRSAFPFE
jgi:hypothetical protein